MPTLHHSQGTVQVETLSTGRNRIQVELKDSTYGTGLNKLETTYPVELIEQILKVAGPLYLCDVISRDEAPTYIRHDVNLLGYVDAAAFDGARVLDFGCGSGASTVKLAQLFPQAEIVGVDLMAGLLSIAEARIKHYQLENVAFYQSPDAESLPAEIGAFDFVILSAVYEHMLPAEREILLPLLWRVLKPGGILFLYDTPYRYFPLELHTSSLPLINYLPDRLAHRVACRFSRRVHPQASWENLLRAGIRGGSVREIMGILGKKGQPASLLAPNQQGMKDRIDLWYAISGTARFKAIKRVMKMGFKVIKYTTGVILTPALSLAIQKQEA